MKNFASWITVLALGIVRLGAQQVITQQPTNQSVILGSNVTFNVAVSSTGPFTYQWQLNGTNLPNNIISTITGGNLFDGLAATNMNLNSPQSLAVDSNKNIYITDTYNHVIRKVGTNGVSQIIAGTGAGGYSGDGGSATNAMLNLPSAVVLDGSGNVFVSDSGNNRVRKINSSGIITTYAGNGLPPITPTSEGNNGQATNANLNFPTGLAFDASGNLYIADTSDNQIRKVTSAGVISCIVNTSGNFLGSILDNISASSAIVYNPEGVALDASGNLYIADTFDARIRKVSASTGNITTIAGTGTVGYSGDGGSATSAKINNYYGVSVAPNGNIFIADSGNGSIRKITNGIISTVAGKGANGSGGDGALATSANLNLPGGVFIDSSNNLYIADSGNNCIRKVTATNGVITTLAGRNLLSGVAATNSTLNDPFCAAYDSVGNLYVVETANACIRKIDTNGNISLFAGSGTIGFAGDGGAATNASLNQPHGVAVDLKGNVFIADTSNLRIRKVDTNGTITTYAGNGSAAYTASSNGQSATSTGMRPWGIAVDNSGNLYTAESISEVVRKIDTNQIITLVAGKGTFGFSGNGGQATNATLAFPYSVFVNANGDVLIGDWGSVRKVDSSGLITVLAGQGYTSTGYSGDGAQATNAQLSQTFGLWSDKIGNVYVSDVISNARIRKIATNGIITSIAGTGSFGYSGDAGPANNAALSYTRAITGDQNGNLLLADAGNNRIRKISYLEAADQPGFTVANVTSASVSNNYSVVITSASGSITSSIVSLNVQLPPVTPALSANGNTIAFTWNSISNSVYQLQFATNLISPAWQNVGNPITATNGTATTSDFPSTGQGFYRVQLVQ
jgi:trimeric autotransporter adhesin